MTPQACKDEVQPAEKAPADVEHTTNAYQNPPQHKKSKPHKVLFIIATVCVVVGLLSLVIEHSVPPGGWDTLQGMLFFYLYFLAPLALVSGAALLLLGLLVYLIYKD